MAVRADDVGVEPRGDGRIVLLPTTLDRLATRIAKFRVQIAVRERDLARYRDALQVMLLTEARLRRELKARRRA